MTNIDIIENDMEEFSAIDINQMQIAHLDIIRNFRNFCAKNPTSTLMFIDHNVVLEVFQKFRAYAFHRIESKIDYFKNDDALHEVEQGLQHTQFQFMTIATQFISNFATCNSVNCAYLWSSVIGESRFQDAIAAASMMKNRKALGAIIHIIHQCANFKKLDDDDDADDDGSFNRMNTFLTWRALNCQILLTVADVKLADVTSSSLPGLSESLSSSGTSTSHTSKDGGIVIVDPALEWLHLLVHLIMRSSSSSTSVKPDDDGVKDKTTCCNSSSNGDENVSRHGIYDDDSLLKLFLLVGPSSSSPSSAQSFCESIQLSYTESHQQHQPSDNNNKCSSSHVKQFTHEQLILLHTLLAVLEDGDCSKEIATIDTEVSSSIVISSNSIQDNIDDNKSLLSPLSLFPCGGLLIHLANLILQQLMYLLYRVGHGVCTDSSSNGNNAPSASTTAATVSSSMTEDGDDDMSSMIETLLLMMNICSTRLVIALREGNSTSSVYSNQQSLSLQHQICTPLIPCLVSYLGYLNQLKSTEFNTRSSSGSSKSDNNNGNSSNNSVGNNNDDNNELQSLSNVCLQLLGNLLYRCPLAQNQLRECGGLLQLLGVCNTDVRHPLRREWALLCLRNACEGSVLNQESISALTLQGVKEVDTRLSAAGLGVDFDTTTGKINFKKT